MYKIASANLQSRNRVIDADVQARMAIRVEDDFIQTAGNMGARECLAERTKLMLEKTRAEQELVAAKRRGNAGDIAALGLRIQSFCSRLSLLRDRLKELRQDNEMDALMQAINELMEPNDRLALLRRKNEILRELDA